MDPLGASFTFAYLLKTQPFQLFGGNMGMSVKDENFPRAWSFLRGKFWVGLNSMCALLAAGPLQLENGAMDVQWRGPVSGRGKKT